MIDRLVVDGIRRHGRFPSRPHDVNPSDEAGWLLRPFHRLRLKEWIGFAVWHPDLWASFIVQDAKLVASSDFIAFAPDTGATRHQVIFPSSAAALPRVLSGRHAGVRRPGYSVRYHFGRPGGTHAVEIDITATDSAEAVHGRLVLDESTTPPPLSMSAPLPGGWFPNLAPGSAIYTYKRIYTVSGSITIGARTHDFDPDRDLAIVDEHRSSLPYTTRWTWGTFATHVDQGVIGANFAHRAMTPGSEDESSIWTPTSIEPLTEVDFDHDPDDPMGPWRVRSRDGRLDLVFSPRNREAVHQQLGLFSVDYFMMQGLYSGTIESAEGTFTVDDVQGVCEHMRARM